MTTQYTPRQQVSTTYKARINKFEKFLTYLIGLHLGQQTYITNSKGDRILLISKSGHEKIDFGTKYTPRQPI